LRPRLLPSAPYGGFRRRRRRRKKRGMGGVLCPHGLAPEAITKRPLRGLEKKKKKRERRGGL
jgi:hypothetical protein